MAVLISLGGNSVGDGFLVAPVGSTYDAELSLATDGGTLPVTLQASPNIALLVFSQTNLTLSTTPTVLTVHATLQSTSREDTTIEVLDGATVVASFTVTSISHPKVHFRGRFEARFATDGAAYNRNPIYTAAIDSVVPPGWTWALEGEPDFVPAIGNIPENLETPVGRVVRLNNPVALRAHAAPVVSTVDAISGQTGTGTERFTVGDPLIGQPVNFGPNSYLAGNNPRNMAQAPPEEFFDAAEEPIALFELHFGSMFSGRSAIGPFTNKATMVNEITRTPDWRPIADGNLWDASAELAAFGLPSLLVFSEGRIDQLVADYLALPAGPSTDRRNLVRRIGHMLNSVSVAKRTAVQAQAVAPDSFVSRVGTLAQGWGSKEIYDGRVNTNLTFQPGVSSVIDYMSDFGSFNFHWEPFGFHSDELDGHHTGFLTHLNMDGSYSGDPHTRTVDGTSYDFQAVGEFTLLRDGERLEVQTRQSPVGTANPITDGYSGLTTCVSINTAVAVRFDKHRIALQPRREGRLQFYVGGKAARLPAEGIDLDGHRVTAFDANGQMGIRLDLQDESVVLITPMFWSAHNVAYLNISVSNTGATEGLMGFIPRDSWLPRLRDGGDVGPMPASLADRYSVLYEKFAESWRVTDDSSLFVYKPGTSTETFTDRDWPGGKPPCEVRPDFQIPGVGVFEGMPVDKAREICSLVTIDDLHSSCVFDVATTGDPTFAEGYQLAQELRLYGTAVRLSAAGGPLRPGRISIEDAEGTRGALDNQAITVTATVVALTEGRPTPTGVLTFHIDGIPTRKPVELDERGRARTMLVLAPGEHKIRAGYSGGGKFDYQSSTSANLVVTVGKRERGQVPSLRFA